MMKPKANIRRFDVFAEYNRQEAMHDGMPADQAKGYGLWLAKLVAARRYGPKKGAPAQKEKAEKPAPVSRGKWRRLDGRPQTDTLFDKEVIDRMGRPFYSKVFVPAIRGAIDHHETYVAIRDRLRQDWNA